MSARPKEAVGERLPYLLSKLKAPRVLERLEQTAERARTEGWPYERFLEKAARGRGLRARRLGCPPAHPSRRLPPAQDARGLRLHGPAVGGAPTADAPRPARLDRGARQRLLPGPAGTGKSHLAIALSIKASQEGFRVAFATAQQWVTRLEAAQERNSLDDELKRLERHHVLVVDEVGYLPLEHQAANLLFALVSRATSAGLSS